MTYKTGDVVKLNSGGPSMTVIGEGDDAGFVNCAWFSENTEDREIHEASFPCDALRSMGP